MTTDKEKWVNHLSDTPGQIKISPFDPSSQAKFERIKKLIQDKLGKSVRVEHRGASSFGISGQDEIDVYVPVLPDKFDKFVILVEEIFGEPRSLYPLQRARFAVSESGKKIDLFVINEKHDDWINGLKFENYLKTHSEALDAYKKLKEEGNGLSTREYYRRKNEFIDQILLKCES